MDEIHRKRADVGFVVSYLRAAASVAPVLLRLVALVPRALVRHHCYHTSLLHSSPLDLGYHSGLLIYHLC
jgi:hypothetical protein